MLPAILNGNKLDSYSNDDMKIYFTKIKHFGKMIDPDFLTQICVDHFERFNNYFPHFDIEKCRISRIKLSASIIYNKIRYDDNEKLDFWYIQFDTYNNELDEDEDKCLFNYMITQGTWPIPPVIIDNKNSLCNKLGFSNAGKAYHLVEGTHRVSYLNRMFEKKLVNINSEHELIMIAELL